MNTLRKLIGRTEEDRIEAGELHERCLSCSADLHGSRSYERYRVCHACGFHSHLTAHERLATLLDAGSFRETDRGVTAIDPLSFHGRRSYRSRVIAEQRRTGLAEAALTGRGAVFGREIVVGVLDFSFLGGSVGVVAGERLARAFERAAARRCAVVTVCSTSGTRMEEGLLALMQGPRVVAAARRHAKLGLPYIAVLTNPTTGSAYAGFVQLADFIFAEPTAQLGYAALRDIEETTGQSQGRHTAESHFAAGLIDGIVARPNLRETIALVLDLAQSDYRLNAADSRSAAPSKHTPQGAWQQLELSRHRERPTSSDLIPRMTASFIEIHGDRTGTDDAAIVAGMASLAGEAVMIIGQSRAAAKGTERGWVRPAGFRKARRAMELAAKFRVPLVTLIDTAGAHPGLESEEAGLGAAMAGCMATMIDLPVPTIAVIVGEGHSEAAAALGAADRVLMLDNAVYEVVRPEDAAKMLNGDAGEATEAAERLQITSHDCLKLGIADVAVPEPGEGAHTNHREAANLLRRAIMRELTLLQRTRASKLVERRYNRYRHVGSTRSRLRGTIERRIAHIADRVAGLVAMLRGQAPARRRDFGDERDIAV